MLWTGATYTSEPEQDITNRREIKIEHALPIFNDLHNCAIGYLNQPYYPIVSPQQLWIESNRIDALDKLDHDKVTLPTPTYGHMYALKALGMGAGITIISSSLGKFVIRSALLFQFMTTAKPTLDSIVERYLTQRGKEEYKPYVTATTTALSLLVAARFLY